MATTKNPTIDERMRYDYVPAFAELMRISDPERIASAVLTALYGENDGPLAAAVYHTHMASHRWFPGEIAERLDTSHGVTASADDIATSITGVLEELFAATDGAIRIQPFGLVSRQDRINDKDRLLFVTAGTIRNPEACETYGSNLSQQETLEWRETYDASLKSLRAHSMS